MTQTGFNLTTLYGAAAQTGITGMYGTTGTGGSYNTLQTGETVSPGPIVFPAIVSLPAYSSAGGYSGSQSGVVSGFVTPVAFYNEDSEATSDPEIPINNTPQNKINESNLYFYKIGNQKYYPCIYCHGKNGAGRMPGMGIDQSYVNGVHYNTGGFDGARNFFAGATSSIATAPFDASNFIIVVSRLPFSSRGDFDTSPYFDTELWREKIQNYIAPDRDRNSWTTTSGQIGGELILTVFPAGQVLKIYTLKALNSKAVSGFFSRRSSVSIAGKVSSKGVDPFIKGLSDWVKSPLNPDNLPKTGPVTAPPSMTGRIPLPMVQEPIPLGPIRTVPGVPVNEGYIFHGEISQRGNAVGYHHRPGGQDVLTARTTIVDPPNAQGVYTGRVEVIDPATNTWISKGPLSSFYPDNWTKERVILEIRGAYGTRSITRGNYWEGTSPSGVRIGGYLNPAGGINTAFPIR